MALIDKLESLRLKYEEIGQQLTDPLVIGNVQKFIKLNKEYKNLEPIVITAKEYKNALANLASSKALLATEKDEDLCQMAKEEIELLEDQIPIIEDKIRVLMIPKDPEDDKNAILEIRAGTGGDEASIFAGDLFRMYSKFVESRRWKLEVTSVTEGTSGGYKEIVASITGNGVYGILKYESGVHRVQRVPQTETQGRVHTSAATVAVLPEADDFDVELRNEDIRKDTYCSSGPGGQSVNTTYSAIRLTHIPTGLVVTCQDEKSQLKNLDKAMRELKTRLYNIEYQKRMDILASKRKTMVSTGDRSAKIRTYNYPQGRITDHRIGLTIYNLNAVMDGDIDEIIEKLQIAENAEKLNDGQTIH